MFNVNKWANWFILLLMAVISFNIYFHIVRIFNKLQGALHDEVYMSYRVDPPLYRGWDYSDSYYSLLFYLIIVFVVYFFSKLAFWMRIVGGSVQSYIYNVAVLIVTLIYTSRGNLYSRDKAAVISLVLLALLVLFMIKKGYFLFWLARMKRLVDRRFTTVVIGIIFLSTVQRIISLIVDTNVFVEGDDPATFFNQAVLMQKDIDNILRGMSMGMVYYLYINIKLFGVTQLAPKLILVMLGAVGLWHLHAFTYKMFKSRLITVYTLLFYVSSSHYVSFSNQFWNENLFVSIFPVFLNLSLKVLESRNLLYAMLLSMIAFYLTLLRSWFPAVLMIWCVYLVFFRRSVAVYIQAGIIVASFFVQYVLWTNYTSGMSGDVRVFATNNSSVNFMIGNNPYSQGTYSRHWIRFTNDYSVEPDEYFNKTVELNLAKPSMLVRNMLHKILLWTISSGGARPISDYYQHPKQFAQYFYRITILLMLVAGFIVSIRKYNIYIVPLLYLSIALIHIVYFADYRFTLTAMPLQAILVAMGMYSFMKKLQHG